MTDQFVKNQTVEVDITGMSHQGFGVGRVGDFVVLTGEGVYVETVITNIVGSNVTLAQPAPGANVMVKLSGLNEENQLVDSLLIGINPNPISSGMNNHRNQNLFQSGITFTAPTGHADGKLNYPSLPIYFLVI